MLHICCIRAGEAFSPAYVLNLYDMVRRNLPDGMEGEFVCFTDQWDDLPETITRRPLPHNLPGWHSKLALFKPRLFPKGDRVIFFDLDTVITGPIDVLAAYDGPFAILRDFYRPHGLQSAVMAWEAGTNTEIWETYKAAGCPTDIKGGDQAWIEETHLEKAVRLQDVFPGMFVSYKQIKSVPDEASVVVFHGKPRPHEVVDGWVPAVWKVGGLTRLELTSVCNTAKEQILDNVRLSIKRDLPWFDTLPEHEGHVAICGGGPSLADRIDELKYRSGIGQTIWALNNTSRFLNMQGVAPDEHVILDARQQNADFIDGTAARYLISSQCHPDVFDRAGDEHVTLWHPHIDGIEPLLDPYIGHKPCHLIGGGTTVGLLAMSMAFLRGYRRIHLYGFDSCYRADKHHAYPQSLNDGEPLIKVVFNGYEYTCAPWMAGQADQFHGLADYLMSQGCTITAHGEGLIQDILRQLVANPTIRPWQVRANEVLKRVEGIENPFVVEVGVFKGDMSEALLKGNQDMVLAMVDSWEGDGKSYDGDSGDFHAGLSAEAQEGFFQKAIDRIAFAGSRPTVWRMRSTKAAGLMQTMEYRRDADLVFIDADHSYAGCKADIEAWWPMVKKGGWIGGHDYQNPDFPKFGVTQAVNEFVAKHNLVLELGENYTWFARKTGTILNIRLAS